MMKKITSKITAAVTACIILISLCLPILTAFAVNDTIEITTAEDFTELAKNCKTDTWSSGKTVILKNDIDLSKNTNCVIPTFCGMFDGGGHTISGVKIDKKGSYMALFRYLQKGGTIKNLNVTGAIIPQGSKKYVGGIIGENSGRIENCTFSGNVGGEANVGGICGTVTESGVITECSFDGSVTGKSYTGGICGQNYGYIKGCKNSGSINTTDTETEKSIQDLDIELEELRTTENIDTSTDTGGICGFSKGAIEGCENRGDVGYPSVGYNTGGICGRQSGTLSGSYNYGTINGRKDIGGICGQAEPYILLEYSEDIIKQVDDVLSRVQAIIDNKTLLSDDLIFNSIDKVEKSMTGVTNSADTISDDAKKYADEISVAVNDASGRLHTALDSSDAVFDDINSGADKLSDGLAHFKDSGEYMKIIIENMDNSAELLQDSSEHLDSSSQYFQGAMNRISDGFDELEDSVSSLEYGSERLKTSVKKLSDALRKKENIEAGFKETQSNAQDIQSGFGGIAASIEDIVKLLEELKDKGYIKNDITSGTEKAKALAECYKEIAAAVSDISDACLILAEEFDIHSVSSAMRLFSRGFSSLSRAVNSLKSAADDLDDALSELDGTSQTADDLISKLQSGLEEMRLGADYISQAAEKLSDIADELTKDGSIKMPSASDIFGKDFDAFSDKVSAMQDEMSGLKNAFKTKKGDLNGEINSLSGELSALSDILSGAYDDHVKSDNDRVKDVSEENAVNDTRGKVENCKNAGKVFSDLNGGGIVGSMAVEYDFDPEDDIKNSGEESLKFTYKTKCVVIRCKNEGTVEMKKDYGGGITGRMDLGSVISCENYGSVAGKDGNYMGGIAGLSDTAIRNCAAKCDLSGNDYIGGIAGKGDTISNCYTLVNVKEYGECAGTIAGFCAKDGMERNYFVGTNLGAADDINYTGIAEETDIKNFADFVKREFNTDVKFTLVFKADEKEIGRVEFEYKSAIPPGDIPKVPEKKGYYGKWSEYNFDKAEFDAVITAEYYRDIELLQSDMKRDNKKSVVLVCGAFDDVARVRVSENTQFADGVKNVIDSVSVNIENVYTEKYTVRYLPVSDKSNIFIEADGKLQKVSTKPNGSYLEFEAPVSAFAVYEVKKDYATVIVLCVIAILVCAMAVFIRKK